MKFYHCKKCGRVVEETVLTKAKLVCCNEEMELLEPNTVDASVEKHLPVVELNGNLVHVKVGSVLHPQTAEHLINFIVLETSNGVKRVDLQVGATPEATFILLPGETVLAVYAYCNLHGLWQKKL